MGLLSVLPEHLSDVELWVTRIFLVLGVLTMGPWTLIIIYDFLFYVWRMATYAIPVVGGRARGRQRPRAPTLTERPSGRPRGFSFQLQSDSADDEPSGAETDEKTLSKRDSLHEISEKDNNST